MFKDMDKMCYYRYFKNASLYFKQRFESKLVSEK